jgi:GNAT superfamily N-acetyltransferase
MIRIAETDDDLARWAAIRVAASPRERAAPPRRDPDRQQHRWGDDACAEAGRSDLVDSVRVAVFVRPHARRQGIGSTLWERLLAHARTLAPRDRLFATVDELNADGVAFAERRGLVEVDREVEQRRRIGDERAPETPTGLELATIESRPELLAAAFEAVGADAYAELPTVAPVTMTLEQWLREEATLPAGSFVAIAGGAVVGYAGLLEHEPGVVEHGLTAVAPTHRRRGIATLLKRRQLAWAAAAGYREAVTWTQGRNSAMQRVNERLGYVAAPAWLKLRGPLP